MQLLRMTVKVADGTGDFRPKMVEESLFCNCTLIVMFHGDAMYMWVPVLQPQAKSVQGIMMDRSVYKRSLIALGHPYRPLRAGMQESKYSQEPRKYGTAV